MYAGGTLRRSGRGLPRLYLTGSGAGGPPWHRSVEGPEKEHQPSGRKNPEKREMVAQALFLHRPRAIGRRDTGILRGTLPDRVPLPGRKAAHRSGPLPGEGTGKTAFPLERLPYGGEPGQGRSLGGRAEGGKGRVLNGGRQDPLPQQVTAR